MSDRPISRQPECGTCHHEQHYSPCDSCPCGIQMPNGIDHIPFLLEPWESA